MRVTMLVLQRKVSYEGEMGPEILACADEVTLDENPDWWSEEVARQKASIANDAIQKALYPEQRVVPVEVI